MKQSALTLYFQKMSLSFILWTVIIHHHLKFWFCVMLWISYPLWSCASTLWFLLRGNLKIEISYDWTVGSYTKLRLLWNKQRRWVGHEVLVTNNKGLWVLHSVPASCRVRVLGRYRKGLRHFALDIEPVEFLGLVTGNLKKNLGVI